MTRIIDTIFITIAIALTLALFYAAYKVFSAPSKSAKHLYKKKVTVEVTANDNEPYVTIHILEKTRVENKVVVKEMLPSYAS